MNAPIPSHFITQENDTQTVHLLIDGMHCPSCVAIIEGALKKQPDVISARLNLSTKRLKLSWNGTAQRASELVGIISAMGYSATPFDAATSETLDKKEEKFLLRCLAVAGFASGNLMLFSVPLWSSSNIEMGTATHSMFQWIQALIAMPAIIYTGLPFYRSAWRAVMAKKTNMDVPISVAVILATAMSLFETITHGQHAYFDSGVMLLFFLLIGRYLDLRARGRARSAAHDLLQRMSGIATVLNADGTQENIPTSEIKEGMILRLAAGEKIGADGTITHGESEIDTSLITGETMPQSVTVGSNVFAGTINISAPVTMRVTKAGERSVLAEIIRLMEHAEQSQARYVSVADAISHWYTPVVHLLAALTFLGWWLSGYAVWQDALLYAATVLIITCPCALGLAVPVVQVISSGILMRQGILIKSGSALERLASITRVMMDKTGTLTVGVPELLHPEQYSAHHLRQAASLAAHSKHPLSQAITRAYHGELMHMDIEEISGCGLQTTHAPLIKLGKRSWCGTTQTTKDTALELWLNAEGDSPIRFTFADQLRTDAAAVVKHLNAQKLNVGLLSGDRMEVVSEIAQQLGITHFKASLSPTEKCAELEALKAKNERVLMVGDGLNDAPSLALATVSMSPASAMDITQNAADIVFQGNRLSPVITAWNIARFAQRLVKENFALAILYNVIAIPLAILGHVTPFIAAIAMSSSSILVIANAMRLYSVSRIE